MKRIIISSFAILVCLFLTQTKAFASSHREAPLISNDPLADNTDVYAFKSPTDPEKVILIANYIPFEHPAGGPNWYSFSENVRYEIHVENNGTPGDDIIYRFTFKQVNEDPTTFFRIRLGKENLKTTYTLERSTNGGSSFTTILTNGIVPPPNIGFRSIESKVGLHKFYFYDLYRSAKMSTSTGERVFAGPVDDPFFVDLGGIFDLGNIRTGDAARDGLARFNCHTLALEVPISTLSKNGQPASAATNILDPNYIIGVYASASRQKITTFDKNTGTEKTSGDWVQVSRLGMPLTNEAIIPVGEKDKWNFTHVNDEKRFEKYFTNPELALYMDDSQFGQYVPGFKDLRIQTSSLGAFDFRNGKDGLYPLHGNPALKGTALDDDIFGKYLLRPKAPRSVDLLPIFYTGVPNLIPYQLATGKGVVNGKINPLAEGKPFINNFLPTFGDMLRLNMAVPATSRKSADFNSLGLVWAAVLGLTDSRFNKSTKLQTIPNMDGFPNGRRLEDDVTRIELQAVSGIVLAAIGLPYDDYTSGPSPATPKVLQVLGFTAGPTQNDTTFRGHFPFVQVPWQGFTGPEVPATWPAAKPAPKSMRWVNFDAEKRGQAAMLTWSVANADKKALYEVEYSTGGPFLKIGTIGANELQRFEFYHSSPSLDKVNNYRIRQVDINGRVSYTDIRSVRFDGRTAFTLSPNPTTDRIHVASDQSNLTLHLFDGSGKKVLTQKMTNLSHDIDVRNLPKGVYTIVAEKDGKQVESTRFVKQ